MAAADQIYQNLLALGYSNSSAAAIYAKEAQAIGLVIDNTLAEFTNTENIITNLLISQYGLGKPLYYTENAKAFQYGDNLVINTAINPVTGAPYLNLIYPTIDATKQIVKQAAFETQAAGNGLLLLLKIATLNALTGLLEPLSIAQYNAFSSYFLNFEIPGLPVTIINTPGNILNFKATASYYAAYDLPTLQVNVSAALISFQQTFDFNGIFFAGDLQDYIKSTVPGIRDFYVYNTTLDGTPFSGNQPLSSGYFNYAAGINTNITYSPVT